MARINDVERAVIEKHGDVVDRIQREAMAAVADAREKLTTEVETFKSKLHHQYKSDLGTLTSKVEQCEQLCMRASDAVADAYVFREERKEAKIGKKGEGRENRKRN